MALRILQLCKKFPVPIKDGEGVAVFNLSKAYHDLGHTIDLLSFNTQKHYQEIDIEHPQLAHYRNVFSSFLDNRVKNSEVLKNVFESESYHIKRFVDSDFTKRLELVLSNNSYDIVQLESLYMAPYIEAIQAISEAQIVMRSHNVEYQIWHNLSRQSRSMAHAWYYGLCARRLKKYEVEQFGKYDLLVPISDVDRDQYLELGYQGNMVTSKVGLNLEDYPDRTPHKYSDKLIFGFIGSLDWYPNINGIRWR